MSEAFDILGAQRRVFDSSLRPLEKLVAFALISFWSVESPQPWPSIATLERRTGLSRRAVFDAVKALRTAGAIVVTPNYPDTLSSRYDLSGMMRLPVHHTHRCTTRTGAPHAPVQEVHRTSAPGAPVPVQEVHPKESMEVIQEGTHGDARDSGSPTKAKKLQRKRPPETALPTDWQPTAAHKAYAAEHGVQLKFQTDAFRGHAEAKGRTAVNWNGAFSTWLAKAAGWQRENASRGKPVLQGGPAVVRENTPAWYAEPIEGAAE